MLAFFRKIRRKLLSEGRFSKYLIYAMGEIVLVVIGILIALSINNWNEAKKNRVYEIKMLTEISSSLKRDITYFEEMIKTYENLDQTADDFMNLSKNNAPYSEDLLSKVFDLNDDINYQFNSGPYEALKSSGIDKITNDKVRMEITSLYDFELPKLGNNIKHITRNHQNNIESMLLLFGDRYIDDSKGSNFVSWSDIPADLFQSQGFLQILAGVSWRAKNAAKQLKQFLPVIEQAVEQIDQEVNAQLTDME